MKKTSTRFLIITALLVFCAGNLFSQIVGLDATRYYLIVSRNSKNAIGVDEANSSLNGALIQQQTRNDFAPIQMWKVVPLTESTYRFINKSTGMALGVSDWRGDNPFWQGSRDGVTSEDKDAQLTVPNFVWRGVHRGICQRTLNESDETQIWNPTQFPANSTSGDTTFYRMTLNMNLADSGFCFNVWERKILPGYRNICLFPGTQEADLYDLSTTLYAFYFVKTVMEVISSVNELSENNLTVYSSDGYIIAEGDIQNKVIEVYNILGKLVYRTYANSSVMHIEAKQAMYFVRIGSSVSKIAVR